jgi:hypothetical protein
MSGDSSTETVFVGSLRAVDGGPAHCLFRWRGLEWYAPVGDVRATAFDLVECAIYAELMMLLVAKVGLPAHVVSRLAADLAEKASPGRRFWGRKSTMQLTPVGSSKTGDAAVLVRRGSRSMPVPPQDARRMAGDWLAAAEASESDQVVAEALSAAGLSGEGWVDGFFAQLRLLRGAAGQVDKLLSEVLGEHDGG